MPQELGRHAGLSRDRVLTAARHIAAERGLTKLTIRSLAETLDVAPNAVYGWVESKAALLDALVDDALAPVHEHPVVRNNTAEPLDQLRALLFEIFDQLMTRPELAPLLLDRATAPGPNTTRIRIRVSELLDASGATPVAAATAVPVLLVHVLGFASFVQQTGGAPLLEGSMLGTPRQLFAVGLDWLLTGITSAT